MSRGWPRGVTECADCGRAPTPGNYGSRGLCAQCARRHRQEGTIGRFAGRPKGSESGSRGARRRMAVERVKDVRRHGPVRVACGQIGVGGVAGRLGWEEQRCRDVAEGAKATARENAQAIGLLWSLWAAEDLAVQERERDPRVCGEWVDAGVEGVAWRGVGGWDFGPGLTVAEVADPRKQARDRKAKAARKARKAKRGAR